MGNLNALIAQGGGPAVEMESPLNSLTKMLQLKNAQQESQFNDQKLQEFQSTQGRKNKLYGVLGGLPQGATNDDRINTLRNNGFLDEADKVEASIASRRKTDSEATYKDSETENKVISAYRDIVGMANDPATAAEYIKVMHSDPRLQNTAIARVPLDMALSQIGQDPESFNAWKQKFGLGAAKFIEMNKPTQTVLNNGSTNQVIQTPGLGGAPRTVMAAPITESANNIANNRRIAQEGALNRGVQERGQESGVNSGKAPSGYRYKPDGTLEAIPGGPADAKTQAIDAQKLAGVTDVDSAVATLRDAYDRLEKGGGITSVKNNSLSNIGSAISSSGVGQLAGKALGTQNQSARNDIAMTRPALLASLMKATGMSAKQMDSNTELKLWMTTATDPTLDVESNRRALANIERKYISKLPNATPAPSNAPPATNAQGWTLHTDANGNRAYVSPDGKQFQEVK